MAWTEHLTFRKVNLDKEPESLIVILEFFKMLMLIMGQAMN